MSQSPKNTPHVHIYLASDIPVSINRFPTDMAIFHFHYDSSVNDFWQLERLRDFLTPRDPEDPPSQPTDGHGRPDAAHQGTDPMPDESPRHS